ncbi:Invertase [Trifolium repens]|nr:Invertase [Trifolium repens]
MFLSKGVTIFVAVISISLLLINNGVEAFHKIYPHLQSVSTLSVKELHRTGYHFQPPRNWINGPMYYNGYYHLFYQYNPKGSVWGNIVWAHSISKDLINWKALEPAIYPSKPFDKYGCWSGSATIIPGKGPIILYTGVIDENMTQVQCYAIPEDINDPFLRKWVKPDRGNPILIADKGVNGSAFRDPTTAWKGKSGHWKMLVGSRRKHRGMAYLYRSRDFMKWVRAKHPIHSAQTGMWECPDFYPVLLRGKEGLDTSIEGNHVKHVLKNSLDITRFEYYTLGTYFSDKDKYVPNNTSEDGWGGLRYDYGNFYASKSFFDQSKNRRIIWGWANESDSRTDDVKKGWAGIQAIPRVVWLDSTERQLVQWPVEELNQLRDKEVSMNNKKLEKGDFVEVAGLITAAQADVEVNFSFSSLEKAENYDPNWVNAQDLCFQKGSKVQGGLGPFGLLTLASENLAEFTPVFFRVFKAPNKHVVLLCSDASSSSLKSEMHKPSFGGFVDVDLATNKLSLRSLIDHSVVESFGEGGKTNILSRVYPVLAVTHQAHLYVFNNGTEPITVENLKAWNMKSANLKGS